MRPDTEVQVHRHLKAFEAILRRHFYIVLKTRVYYYEKLHTRDAFAETLLTQTVLGRRRILKALE